jgi:hypothetical protein
VAVAKQGSKSNIKNGAAELATLTYDEYPSEVGTLISYFEFMNTDLRFVRMLLPSRKKLRCNWVPCHFCRKESSYCSSKMFNVLTGCQAMQHLQINPTKNSTIHLLVHKQFPAIKSSDDKPTNYVTPKTM